MRSALSIACSIAFIAMPAKSHEFWIAPSDFQVDPGGAIVASLKVGQGFEGSDQSYIPRNFRRFEYVQGGKAMKMPGTVGDKPAVNLPVSKDGLVILVHETTDRSLTWETWEKFTNFLKHKDAAWVIAEHEAKGFGKEDVREAYSRYAKSLVAVGGGAGKDGVTGMPTEIVALENPYTGNMADGINVVVLYKGKPRVASQIEVFERAPGGGVRVFTVKSNSEGLAVVPVVPGAVYMLDSVVLRATDKATTGGTPFLWESLWANLTFKVPAR